MCRPSTDAVLLGPRLLRLSPGGLPCRPVTHNVRPHTHQRHPEDRIGMGDGDRDTDAYPKDRRPTMETSKVMGVIEY
jgi:hypothetical protein